MYLLFSSALGGIGSVLLAVLILLAMITVHEFGHYLSGRALGFAVEEFSVGFGPALFKRKSRRTGELFSIRAVPLGGYCAFAGEEGEGGFNAKPPWKRIIVLVSGALANYLLAVALIMVAFAAFGQTALRIDGVTYPEGYDSSDSFVAGDVLLRAEGRGIYLTTDIMDALAGKSAGERVDFTVSRGGKETDIGVELRADCNFSGSADTSLMWEALGVDSAVGEDGVEYLMLSSVNVRFPFFESVGRSFAYSVKIGGTIFRVLGELITGNLSLNAVGGPVTTINLTSQLAAQWVQSMLEIAAYIGVNLAVFNLLPIPALDGSKVVFCLIEQVRGRPVSRKVESAIHFVGFIFILGFALLADLLQFVRCG